MSDLTYHLQKIIMFFRYFVFTTPKSKVTPNYGKFVSKITCILFSQNNMRAQNQHTTFEFDLSQDIFC